MLKLSQSCPSPSLDLLIHSTDPKEIWLIQWPLRNLRILNISTNTDSHFIQKETKVWF